MKKILTVYTGGTIGTASIDGQRKLSSGAAKRAIAVNFTNSDSPYAHLGEELFFDSDIDASYRTLSENMTLPKLSRIAEHIMSFDLSKFSGVIVLHGTDALAYTAAFLSLLLCHTPVPVMLVSANRPPMDPETNANVNFRAATELIMAGIAPNVYVPYRNADDDLRLHMGAGLMQCANFSEDFFSAVPDRKATMRDGLNKALTMGERFYAQRGDVNVGAMLKNGRLAYDGVMLIQPYVGLRYDRLSVNGALAVVHGTYHSGTVCVERGEAGKPYSERSILSLLHRCDAADVPVYIAPSHLGEGQYSSAFDAAAGGAVPLGMTVECAYAKAVIGVSAGLTGDELTRFMQTEVNSEFVG